MGWVDEVPRAGGVYIGGLHALFQKPELFKEAKITHILSVLDYDVYKDGRFEGYKHKQIRLEDDPNENLLQHFPTANQFIDSAIHEGGAVYVHCAMGKSRSATVVCAFLMWKFRVSPLEALDQLCEGRPVCSPNPGFMEQLDTYYRMLQVENELQSERIYQDWLKSRFTGDAWSWEKRSVAKL